jgi:hypothetical protein
MIGLPFITELFTNILKKSKGIEGRLFYCPGMGKEINTDDFDKVIEDQFAKDNLKKYPCVIMPPPVAQGNFTDPKGEWVKHQFIHFFLTTTFYSGTNQIKNPNPNTQTSTHTILHDQHDMDRCARSFIWALNKTIRDRGLIKCKFRLDSSSLIIRYVANIGVNRLSGVRLDFNGSVFNGCTIEDYETEDIGAIVIPEMDSHPEHQL